MQSQDADEEVLGRALERAEMARKELDIEISGLRLAVARLRRERGSVESRFAGRLATPDTVPAIVSEWRAMGRSDAVLRVLAQVGHPLHRKNLTDLLHTAGRDDEIEDVSATLSYLGRDGRVRSLGDGMWEIGSADLPLQAGGSAVVDSVHSYTGGDEEPF